MLGYTSGETKDAMSLTHSNLGNKLNDVYKNSDPLAVAARRQDSGDDRVRPASRRCNTQRIHAVAIPSQHAEPLGARRLRGPEDTSLSMEDMSKLIKLKVFRKTLEASVPMLTQRQVLTIQSGQKTVEIPPAGSHQGGQVCRVHLPFDCTDVARGWCHD